MQQFIIQPTGEQARLASLVQVHHFHGMKVIQRNYFQRKQAAFTYSGHHPHFQSGSSVAGQQGC